MNEAEMGDSELYVTEGQCKERRDSCKELREHDCSSRDAWVGKLEKKIDALTYIAITQLCALVIALVIWRTTNL